VGLADPVRSARLEMPPPVRMFWLLLGPDPRALSACVAYCEACKRSDRSGFDGGNNKWDGQDEREALQRLKERQVCPHTEVAEIVLSLHQLEEPMR